ncbi:MAG: helix-turn-helix domain-containing protein [Devosia sp.]|uniref:helix-turn-helix domain-containing protein n=1 Tax=Devosia sp. TaxID=1871048 RepID=UPI0024CB3923|nr:helix-turn-helix domain-containing protein [Devosia sp.]UYO01237.1 MAG: helix-turn-helix domain-containing protein [Devosia sp.]
MNLIPTYALYGEQETLQDWLHWETIPARSRLHGFRIDPHRHEHLFQVLSLTAGEAEMQLDGTRVHIAAGSMVVVPAMVVHGYVFSPDVDGVVLTLFEQDVRTLGLGFDGAETLRASDRLVASLDGLIGEADHPGHGHDMAMRARLTLLLLDLHRARRAAMATPGPSGRAVQHVAGFRDLVEQRYRTSRRIEDYASAMGISPTHLNRVCQQVLGVTALEVVERRIALEARRQLLFSTLSVKQIGAELGYDDPAYFSRVMTRLLGAAPARFRAEQGRNQRA